MALRKASGRPQRGAKIYWPSWRFGPNDQSAIFNSEDEVPEGWHDHPSKVGDPDAVTESRDPAVAEEDNEDEDEAELFVLPDDEDGIDKKDIITQLEVREVTFSSNWAKTRLYNLLRDTMAAQADNEEA